VRRLGFALAALALAVPMTAAAAEPEHEVKAAFLFKFLTYVDWPDDAFPAPDAPIVIGVIDADDVRRALEEIIAGRTAQGRKVEVRKLKDPESVSGLHMVFVGRGSDAALSKLPRLPGLLVVGESDSALDRGAMINLLLVGDHVRFQVAPETAERRGLHISSRMLALAQHVDQGVRP
jgi:uncharacterized protein DUF4154